MKNISLLGSTGSIGTQALDVARKLGHNVVALTANSRVDILEQQMREFRPKYVAIADKNAANELKNRTLDLQYTLLVGEEGICQCASLDEADLVLNSVVGIAGLRPTLAAINAHKSFALANKESLVTGGELVMNAAREAGITILPVDSEHSAIFQCLNAAPPNRKVEKIILTASGGPFYGRTADELRNVTVGEALNHPNWSMGKKISIDSATMMNKGLEVIEAVHLFGVCADDIQVVVHRESLLHSAVEFTDGSIIGQIGVHDMRVPIQYAMTYPERETAPCERLDLITASRLTFDSPDTETFRCLDVCINAIKQGGFKPIAANGANEAAVALFLNGQIGFMQIGELVSDAVDAQPIGRVTSVDDILAVDASAREYVLSHARHC